MLHFFLCLEKWRAKKSILILPYLTQSQFKKIAKGRFQKIAQNFSKYLAILRITF